MCAGASQQNLLRSFFRIEAYGVRTKDIGALCTRILVEIISADTEMIIVHRAGQRAITIVLPGAGASFVIRDNDDVEVVGRHVADVLCAQISNALEVTPSCVRMKISDQ